MNAYRDDVRETGATIDSDESASMEKEEARGVLLAMERRPSPIRCRPSAS